MPLKEAARVTASAARATVRSDVPGTQRGVALLVVLVTMAIMGALSTEFAYNTRANIWMAGNVTASTQAYYHARSVSKIATLAVNAKRIFPQLKTVLSMMGKSQSTRLEIWRQACEFAKIFATGKAEFFGLQVLDLSGEDAIGFKKGSFECTVTAEDSRTNLNAAATDPPSNLGQLGSKKPRSSGPVSGNKLQTSRKQLGLKLYGLLRPMLETGQFDSEEEIFDVIINVMDWTDSDELRTDVDAAGNFIDGAGDEDGVSSDGEELLTEQELDASECFYVGDDLTDVPVLRSAGIGAAVADALPEVRERADLVLETAGGRGAVREAIVRLMEAQGTWKRAAARYLEPEGES